VRLRKSPSPANLKIIFRGLAVVGSDVDPSGNIRTSTILIESMTLAGS